MVEVSSRLALAEVTTPELAPSLDAPRLSAGDSPIVSGKLLRHNHGIRHLPKAGATLRSVYPIMLGLSECQYGRRTLAREQLTRVNNPEE